LIAPGAQDAAFSPRQSGTGGRHLEAVLGTGYLLNELAFGAVTGYERRAGITSLESGLLLIEPQPIHLLGGAMASVAILMKNGFDVAQKLHGCLDRRWQRRRILCRLNVRPRQVRDRKSVV